MKFDNSNRIEYLAQVFLKVLNISKDQKKETANLDANI